MASDNSNAPDAGSDGSRPLKVDTSAPAKQAPSAPSSPLAQKEVQATNEEAKQVGLKIFKYCDRKDKILMTVGGCAAILSGFGMPAYSQINGNIMGKLASSDGDLYEKMCLMALSLVIVGIVMALFQSVRSYCIHYSTLRQTTRIKLLYFKALMRQEVGWHDAHPPGELTSRMDGDVKVIERAMGDNFQMLLQHFGTIAFAYGVAFYNGWELTLFMLGAMPFIGGVSILCGRWVVTSSMAAREAYNHAGGIALEAIDNIKTVQAFGTEEFESDRFSAAVAPAVSAGIKRDFATYLTGGANNFIVYIVYGCGFWFGGYLIAWGRRDVGEVLVVFFSCLMASFAVGRISPCLSTFIEGATAASKIFEVIDRVPPMDPIVRAGEDIGKSAPDAISSGLDDGDAFGQPAQFRTVDVNGNPLPPGGLLLPDKTFKTAITFKDVAFSYPTRPNDKLFTKLNVTIKKGQTVAFSGASGCGKSSIIGLVQRYYDPCDGSVTVDGLDMRDLNLRGWRDCISIVSQEPKLFTGTIMENVKIAKPDATDDEVIEACKRAHVHQVIAKLPQQYNTLVGTGGSQLSGGQKQRVAIARALIRKPQILILDEATSALDRKSEIEVQAALENIMSGSCNGKDSAADALTVIVIAHRLATIRNADVIHYINHDDVGGSWIEESGSYDELMQINGHFAAMTRKQGSGTAGSHDAPASRQKTLTEIVAGTTSDIAAFAKDAAGDASLDALPNGTAADTPPQSQATPTASDEEEEWRELTAEEEAKLTEEERTARAALKKKIADAKDTDEDAHLYAKQKEKTLKEIDDEGVKATPSYHMRVLKMCGSDHWGIELGCLGCLLAGLDSPAYAIIFTYVLEILAEIQWNSDAVHKRLPIWCIAFFIIAAVSLIAHLMMGAFAYVGERLTLKLRRVLFYSILRQDMTFFDTPGRDSSSLASVISTDAEVVHGMWGPSIGSKLQLVATLGGGLVVACIYSWRCALVTLACMPSFMILMAVSIGLLKAFGGEDDGAIKAEALTNIRTVVSLNLQDTMIARYTRHVIALDEKQKYNALVKAIQGGGMGFVMFSIMALVAWYSGKLITDGTNTFLEVMIAQQAVMAAIRGLNEIGEISSKYRDSANASARVFYIVDRKPTIAAAPPADLSVMYGNDGMKNLTKKQQAALDTISGAPNKYVDVRDIEFSDVRFRYPARPEAPLLRGVDLKFTTPEAYGLMGETGCGKSTLIGLITRMYDPAAGEVTVAFGGDDAKPVNLKDMDLAQWRANLSLVLQEPSLFSGTIRDNIRYSARDATDAEIEQAARYASIHDDIMMMPDGYDTDVGYKGQSLSGGQKQRVAIARALVRKPRVLLMDEATSALDNATEGRVEKGLRDASAAHKMIVVSVAHRLTTIRDSNKIAVMEAGRVKEFGSHEELMALGGHYKDRWELFESSADRQKAATK